MKKLTNRQLSLIVERIVSEINSEISIENQKVLDTVPKETIFQNSKYFNKVKDIISRLNDIEEEESVLLKELKSLRENVEEDEGFDSWYKDTHSWFEGYEDFLIKSSVTLRKKVSSKDVETDIILSEVDNLEDLVQTIKDKYLNKQ